MSSSCGDSCLTIVVNQRVIKLDPILFFQGLIRLAFKIRLNVSQFKYLLRFVVFMRIEVPFIKELESLEPLLTIQHKKLV